MDVRLVFVEARGRRAKGMLYPVKSARWARTRKLRPKPAADQDSPQGDQGRLAPLRAELLPPLSPGSAPCTAYRHVNEPCWLSLHYQREDDAMSDDRLKGTSQDGTPQNNDGLKRRDLLLSSSTLLAASVLSA